MSEINNITFVFILADIDRHDITEILLKVALNTINQTLLILIK